MDGDGQMIAPPLGSKSAPPSLSPVVVAPAAAVRPDRRGREKEL
jgi:hypothetical protein